MKALYTLLCVLAVGCSCDDFVVKMRTDTTKNVDAMTDASIEEIIEQSVEEAADDFVKQIAIQDDNLDYDARVCLPGDM